MVNNIICLSDTPCTPFQSDIYSFLKRNRFTCCVDEDGELMMYSEDEPFCIMEFKSGSETYIEWEELQERYNDGER